MDCFSMGRLDDVFNLFEYKLIKKLSDRHYQFEVTFNDLTTNRFHIRHGGTQALLIDHIPYSLTDDLVPLLNCITTKMYIDYHSMIRSKKVICDVVLEEINKKDGYFIVKLLSSTNKICTQARLEFAILKNIRKSPFQST